MTASQAHAPQDPLTGLGDLPAFLTRLDRAMARAVERSRPLAVLMIDLDDFAALNERRGHDAGDQAIQGVAAALCAVAGDYVAEGERLAFRLDGDEFALVLPDADGAAAREVAGLLLGHEGLRQTPLSIGIGVATPEGACLGQLLLDAEGALRAAKRQGGRRVVLDEPAPRDEPGASALVSQLARRLIAQEVRLEEAYQLAFSDPVTGLPNQRALYRFLEAEVPRALRHERAFSLLLIDGDNLKEYNDRLGYAAGDEWIKTLGDLLVRATRASDLIARWRSGDEFIAALPETGREPACQLAERIRAAVEQLSRELPLPVTVSIGVAGFPDDAIVVDELLARVEAANQRAKSAGKNRIVVASGAQERV